MIIIPLAIERPFFEVAARDASKAKNRADCYRRGYLMTLILFVIAFPFVFLSVNNFCCYDEDAVTYSKYLQIGARTVRYEDVDSIQISIHQSNNGKVDCFKYVLVCDGDSIDLNVPNTGKKYFTEDVYKIHRLLEEKGDCTADITPLNDVTRDFVEGMDEGKSQIALYIFEGFHR